MSLTFDLIEWIKEYTEAAASIGLTVQGLIDEVTAPDDDGQKDWDESEHPRVPAGSSEGGQWTEDGGPGDLGISDTLTSEKPSGPKPITEGVDLKGNAERLLSGVKLTPEQEAAAKRVEADLRDAPFIHGADADAVKAILTSGVMLSNEGLEEQNRKLRGEWSDIMYEEVGDLLESKKPGDREAGERFLARLDNLSTQSEMSWVEAHRLTEQVCNQLYGETDTRPIADSIIHKLGVARGNTNQQDVDLGLNRYVFGALYEPNEGYGGTFVIVNRNQMARQGSFISKNDIANIGYDVARYKEEIIAPSDWAHTAAVLMMGGVQKPADWEAKIPNRVPKSAILGVVTTTPKAMEELQGLGVSVRYMPFKNYEGHRDWTEQFRYDALYLQRNGKWPPA